jgi:hypothetical protein
MAFTDRVVEYPGRVVLTPTGNANEYDMTRSEGTVTEEGTALNATNLNTIIQDMIDNAIAPYSSALDVDANGNVHFRNLQSGSVQMKVNTAKTTVTATVTFPRAFTKLPKIVVTPLTASPAACSVSVSNVSTTGFTVYFYRTTATNTYVYWIAFV